VIFADFSGQNKKGERKKRNLPPWPGRFLRLFCGLWIGAEGPQRFSVTCCYRGVGVAGRFVSGATGPAKTQQKEVCYFFFEPFFDDDFLVVFLELDFLAMHVTSFLGKHSKGEKICRQRFFESPAENFPRARR